MFATTAHPARPGVEPPPAARRSSARDRIAADGRGHPPRNRGVCGVPEANSVISWSVPAGVSTSRAGCPAAMRLDNASRPGAECVHLRPSGPPGDAGWPRFATRTIRKTPSPVTPR